MKRERAQVPQLAIAGGRRALWNLARESSTLLFIVIDAQEVILYTNRTLPACAQTTVAATVGRPLGEFVAPADSLPTRTPFMGQFGGDRLFSLATLGRASPRRFRCSMERGAATATIVGEPRESHWDEPPGTARQAPTKWLGETDGEGSRGCAHVSRCEGKLPRGSPNCLEHLREVFEIDRLLSRMEGLSQRELEVMRLLAEGLPSKLIAQRLHLSTRTVNNHRTRITGKLQAGGAADLTRCAVHAAIFRAFEELGVGAGD